MKNKHIGGSMKDYVKEFQWKINLTNENATNKQKKGNKIVLTCLFYNLWVN